MRMFNYVSATLLAMLLVGCDGDARPFEEAVEVRTENLKSIAVVPPSITVPELIMNFGETVQFGVQGTSVVGQTVPLEASDRNWQITEESVGRASINDQGQLVAKANGKVGVLVSIGGLVSETYDLRVSDSTLAGVTAIIGEPTMERCLPQDYQAQGIFEDGDPRDLTGVDWALATEDEDAGNARLLDDSGLAATVTGLNASAVTLTATVGGFSLSSPITIQNTLKALEISPKTGSVEVDDVATFAAFGEYLDADAAVDAIPRTENVTTSVDWEIVTGTTFASVTNNADSRGEVTGLASGSANLSVSCGDMNSLSIPVIVSDSTDGDTDGLSFLRDSVTLIVGNSTTLSVSTGSRYSSANGLDNDDLTWELSVDNTLSPAIRLDGNGTNAGRIEALAVGGASITVTDDDGASASIRVEVTRN